MQSYGRRGAPLGSFGSARSGSSTSGWPWPAWCALRAARDAARGKKSGEEAGNRDAWRWPARRSGASVWREDARVRGGWDDDEAKRRVRLPLWGNDGRGPCRWPPSADVLGGADCSARRLRPWDVPVRCIGRFLTVYLLLCLVRVSPFLCSRRLLLPTARRAPRRRRVRVAAARAQLACPVC